ncbi:MAG: VCBS repeat-containing protein [Phycisphaeraceae bacterium]|nr:VCBS repeat-containing protein [Phycisphaeraceae bacterium]
MSGHAVAWLLALCALAALTPSAEADTFPGWQGLRVIEQDGWPGRMFTSDLDGDGRDEVVVVNSRQARLEVLRWVTPENREPVAEPPADQPNILPMAPEFEREEIPIEQLPLDAVAEDLDGDGKAELLILVSGPNRLIAYQSGDDGWTPHRRWNLLPGSYSGQNGQLLTRPGPDGSREAMISLETGFQQLTLTENSRPRWLMPRTKEGRTAWWLTDVDGDSAVDILTFHRGTERSLRWRPGRADGFGAPQILYDQPVNDARPLTVADQTQFVMLGGQQAGLVRRFALGRGEKSPLGQRQPITLPENASWTGLQLPGGPALVAVDTEAPRLLVFSLDEQGWSQPQAFPSVTDVEQLVTLPDDPSAVILRRKGAADLHVSRYDGQRMSYPQPMGLGDESDAERVILGLGRLADRAWWVQRIGEDLVLSVRHTDGQTKETRFPDIGEKAAEARWVGGSSLLVKDKYARHPRRISLADDNTVESSGSGQLKNAEIDSYRPVLTGDGSVGAIRLTDGAVQQLDASLQPTDQIMLPEGQPIGDFIQVTSDAAWALERGGETLYRLSFSDTGLAQIDQTWPLPGGQALHDDPVLGLVLAGPHGPVRLSAGAPRELQLHQSIDPEAGRAAGVREPATHRIATLDLDGNGSDELIAADDQHHQLTAFSVEDGELTPMLSWPVYEDRTYPYGGGVGDQTSSEPRSLAAGDLDGDGHTELIMLIHDRVLIYLARDKQASPEGASSDE